MSEFKPIETQEEFDARIGERLKRARESAEKAFEGWKSPEDVQKLTEEYDGKIKALEDSAAAAQQALAEKDNLIAEGARYRDDLEKTKIALAAGLKMEYADRLRGENAEEWKKDAETLAKDFAAAHIIPPMGSAEPVPSDNPANAWLSVAQDLKN